MLLNNFNMTAWCQELLSCKREPTGISTAMVNYVLMETVDQEIVDMGSYKEMKLFADSVGLKYSELALTALRGLASVPQEGFILVTVFRYLQATTGQELTKTTFVDFFQEGMFKVKDMVRIYNEQADDHGDCISRFNWEDFKQETN